ncbi:hypothetical protein BC939DRAFT_452328 [Gamsiella multidivaricata]|uniref:uncharacterized protein n=1 Tax=Gamsiella multidivaricata TaxID=101098 RepID=UPI00221F7DFB|nr:uncharacterized protein BC939DRAFT_452328 [Gamsiella multidivaricata]KAI7822955.1 hypothetical protein BC939DRAFT_452328 [Gamsiella multidivaricata]
MSPPPSTRILCTEPPTGALASPLWTPFHRDLVARMKAHATVPTRPIPSADFLVLSFEPSMVTATFAFICLSSTQDMDAILLNEINRILYCIQRYGAHQTAILLMIQPGHASCLQTLESFLLNKIVPDTLTGLNLSTMVASTIGAPSRQSLHTRPSGLSLDTSALNMPHLAVCHSCADASDILTHLLDQAKAHSSPVNAPLFRSTSLLRTQNQQPDARNPFNPESHSLLQDPGLTWLSIPLSTRDGPALTIQDCQRLRTGLSTIQNVALASSSQLQDSCLISNTLAKSIEAFFETDQPI